MGLFHEMDDTQSSSSLNRLIGCEIRCSKSPVILYSRMYYMQCIQLIVV